MLTKNKNTFVGRPSPRSAFAMRAQVVVNIVVALRGQIAVSNVVPRLRTQVPHLCYQPNPFCKFNYQQQQDAGYAHTRSQVQNAIAT